MRVELRERYVDLVNYLGLVLGPSYEIALHDLSMGDETIIAIANGHITNRTIGSPLTPMMLDFISSKRYLEHSYEVNYYSKSVNEKVLRSSTIYIKDNGELVGLLCITFDDSHFKAVSNKIMSLCHPDELIKGFTFEKIDDIHNVTETEVVSASVEELVNNTIDNLIKKHKLNENRIKKKDRLLIVSELIDKGIFLLKGAVNEVSLKLNSSEATIYRYLNEIETNRE